MIGIASYLRLKKKKGMEIGFKEGFAQGIAQSKERRRIEEKREYVRKLKELGVTTDVISQVTGLLKGEIDNI